MDKREEILNKAIACTMGDRNRDYGSPYENLKHTAELWSAYFGILVTAEDVAHCQQLVKMSRTKSGPYKEDNYVDNSAYGSIAGECRLKEDTKDDTPHFRAATETCPRCQGIVLSTDPCAINVVRSGESICTCLIKATLKTPIGNKIIDTGARTYEFKIVPGH